MAPATEGQVDPNIFPEAGVLEKWMMGTAKEADRSAAFLRRMLQMNPSYGQYLSKDEELCGIVQLFAKRFRNIIMGAESPIQPASLYKPICELAWRVVGQVLSSMTEFTEDLQGQKGADAQGQKVPQWLNDLPAGKGPQGQMKMLLQTNLDLSDKLNSARRAYLRELCAHRDQQRELSEKVNRTVASLKEHPIMFYEPLEFVLDDTTKDFVRDVVEERVKLEMRAGFSEDEANAEVSQHMEDLEQQVRKLTADLRKANGTAMKNEDRAKRAEQALVAVQDEGERLKALAKEREKEADNFGAKVESLESDLALKARRIAYLEDQKQGSGNSRSANALEHANSQLNEQHEITRALQAKLAALEQEKKAQSVELAAAQAKLEKSILELPSPSRAAPPPLTSVVASPTSTHEVQTMFEEERVVEKIVYVEDPSLREQLDKSIQVEDALREANEALEEQLEEMERRLSLSATAGTGETPSEVKKEEPEKDQSKGNALKEKNAEKELRKAAQKRRSSDEEIQKALREVSQHHEKVAKDQQATIDRLQAELDAALARLEEPHENSEERRRRKTKKPGEEVDDSEAQKGAKWRQRYDELSDQHDDLQNEYDKLEQKVAMLVDKLKEVGGAEVVQETLARIKLTPPPPKKKRKKKAFERLYDDAQRRIVDLRVKAERAERAQERVLVDAASKINDKRSLMAVKNLCHLQKAAATTTSRFTEAVSKFQNQHPDDGRGNPGTLYQQGVGLRRQGTDGSSPTIPEEGAPEWLSSDTVAPQGSQGRARSSARSTSQPSEVEIAISQVHGNLQAQSGNIGALRTTVYGSREVSANSPVTYGAAASPARQSTSLLNLSRGVQDLGGNLGYSFRQPAGLDSPGPSPNQRSASFGTMRSGSCNLQPMLLRHQVGDVDLSFQGQRVGVALPETPGPGYSRSSSSTTPGQQEDAASLSSSNADLQALLRLAGRSPAPTGMAEPLLEGLGVGGLEASVAVDASPAPFPSPAAALGASPSGSRFARLGAEAVLGARVAADTPGSRSHASFQSMTSPPRRPTLDAGSPEATLRPQDAGAASLRRANSPRGVAASVRDNIWSTPTSTYTRQLPLAGATSCTRSTPDLTVTATQYQREGHVWDPLGRKARHRSKAANVSMVAMQSSSLVASVSNPHL